MHDLRKSVLALFFVLVGVLQLLGYRVDQQLALVDKDYLHRLVVQPENNCVFGTEPTPYVHQLLLVDLRRTESRLVLCFRLQVTLKVVEKAHFLLEFGRVVSK